MTGYTFIQPTDITEHGRPSGIRVNVFLAGTIEMGAVPDWQKDAANKIASMVDDDHHPVFMSPRRDTGFKPGMEEEQIVWEQDRLDSADLIYMYIDENSKSPISLLEFGEYIGTGKLITVCGKRFYRYQNLEYTARHKGMRIYNDVDEAMAEVARRVNIMMRS